MASVVKLSDRELGLEVLRRWVATNRKSVTGFMLVAALLFDSHASKLVHAVRLQIGVCVHSRCEARKGIVGPLCAFGVRDARGRRGGSCARCGLSWSPAGLLSLAKCLQCFVVVANRTADADHGNWSSGLSVRPELSLGNAETCCRFSWPEQYPLRIGFGRCCHW